jgi:hypothetical protein
MWKVELRTSLSETTYFQISARYEGFSSHEYFLTILQSVLYLYMKRISCRTKLEISSSIRGDRCKRIAQAVPPSIFTKKHRLDLCVVVSMSKAEAKSAAAQIDLTVVPLNSPSVDALRPDEHSNVLDTLTTSGSTVIDGHETLAQAEASSFNSRKRKNSTQESNNNEQASEQNSYALRKRSKKE